MKMKSYAQIAKAAMTGLTVVSLAVLPVPASAQMAVFDSTNYAQNLLQAARALEQINNQIKSLQNEATMLQNMARNLERIDFPQLTKINSALQQVDGLMSQAKGIDFKVDQLEQQFLAMFPHDVNGALKSAQPVADAKSRLNTAMNSFRHSMAVQSQVVSNIRDDAQLLNELVGRSQDAA